jgi:hypothetical protein
MLTCRYLLVHALHKYKCFEAVMKGHLLQPGSQHWDSLQRGKQNTRISIVRMLFKPQRHFEPPLATH